MQGVQQLGAAGNLSPTPLLRALASWLAPSSCALTCPKKTKSLSHSRQTQDKDDDGIEQKWGGERQVKCREH